MAHRSLSRRRPAREHGFTLIELLLVLIIVGILIAIAVPAYLTLRSRSEEKVAKANIRAAVPAMEAYSIDNFGDKNDADGKKNTTGYKGATTAILIAAYDSGISPSLSILPGKTNATQYCLVATQGSETWSALGPGINGASFVSNAKCK